jgi:hypothetical protein
MSGAVSVAIGPETKQRTEDDAAADMISEIAAEAAGEIGSDFDETLADALADVSHDDDDGETAQRVVAALERASAGEEEEGYVSWAVTGLYDSTVWLLSPVISLLAAWQRRTANPLNPAPS